LEEFVSEGYILVVYCSMIPKPMTAFVQYLRSSRMDYHTSMASVVLEEFVTE
jgi:hypothetical protein